MNTSFADAIMGQKKIDAKNGYGYYNQLIRAPRVGGKKIFYEYLLFV